MSSEVAVEGAKCEELEQVIIDSDRDRYFLVGFSCLHKRRKSWLPSLGRMLICSLGALIRLSGWTQTSFVTI